MPKCWYGRLWWLWIRQYSIAIDDDRHRVWVEEIYRTLLEHRSVRLKYRLISYIWNLGYTTSLLFSKLASKIVLLFVIHLFIKSESVTFMLLNLVIIVRYNIDYRLNTYISFTISILTYNYINIEHKISYFNKSNTRNVWICMVMMHVQ